jgi:hypothetical protein
MKRIGGIKAIPRSIRRIAQGNEPAISFQVLICYTPRKKSHRSRAGMGASLPTPVSTLCRNSSFPRRRASGQVETFPNSKTWISAFAGMTALLPPRHSLIARSAQGGKVIFWVPPSRVLYRWRQWSSPPSGCVSEPHRREGNRPRLRVFRSSR